MRRDHTRTKGSAEMSSSWFRLLCRLARFDEEESRLLQRLFAQRNSDTQLARLMRPITRDLLELYALQMDCVTAKHKNNHDWAEDLAQQKAQVVGFLRRSFRELTRHYAGTTRRAAA